jgi:hypothetical protein
MRTGLVAGLVLIVSSMVLNMLLIGTVSTWGKWLSPELSGPVTALNILNAAFVFSTAVALLTAGGIIGASATHK